MKTLIKALLIFLFLSLAASDAAAIDMRNPRTANPDDSVRAARIIDGLVASGQPLGRRIAAAAEMLVGGAADTYYTADSVASLRVDLSSHTPLMFVNNAVALAKASMASSRPSWRDYVAVLQEYACRRGVDSGFASIMYHTSDWIGDNVFRGNLRELTDNYSGVVARTKSLDEMTRYRDRFAALSDSAVFETVRMNEMGYRTHRVPTLKKETISKKEVLDDLRDGDVLILVPPRDGIDCYDIGVVTILEDGPHLIHLSPLTGKVEMEADNLTRYFKLVTRHFQGYRIIRIQP